LTEPFLGKLAVKGVFKNYLSIIEEFIANMNKMNAEFDLDGRIVTEALVYRVANTVGEIGTLPIH